MPAGRARGRRVELVLSMHTTNTILVPAAPPAGHRLRLMAQRALLVLPVLVVGGALAAAAALLF